MRHSSQNRRSDVHGDFDLLKAICQDECVLIGVVLFKELSESFVVGGKGIESVDLLDEGGVEGAGDVGFFDLGEDVEPGIPGAEEEAEVGGINGVEVRAGEGDVGDIELEAALVSETEFVEGDDGAIV